MSCCANHTTVSPVRAAGISSGISSSYMKRMCSCLNESGAVAHPMPSPVPKDGRWEYEPHHLSHCAAAQRTRARHCPACLTPAEVAAVLAAGQRVRRAGGATLRRFVDAGEFRTTYLHAASDELIGPEAAAALSKLVQTMRAEDAAAGWGLLDARHAVRCIEYHEQQCISPEAGGGGSDAGGGVSTGAASATHYDAGSLVTIDVMLSQGGAFEGGRLTTPEADGALTPHPLVSGDALCFVSHKFHYCTPVTRGTREVLVIELWRGPARSCPHRCLQPTGECNFVGEQPEDDTSLLPDVCDSD